MTGKVNVGSAGKTPKKRIIYDPSQSISNGYKNQNTLNTFSADGTTGSEENNDIDVNQIKNNLLRNRPKSSPSGDLFKRMINIRKQHEADIGTSFQNDLKFRNPKKTETKKRNETIKERPKTSRGKAHPSPDEFFDYVIPSPDIKRNGRSVLLFPSGNQQRSIGTIIKDEDVAVYEEDNDEDYEILNEKEEPVNINVDKQDKIKMLGCWLFGTALRI